jgi:hypothetical protein
VRDHDVSAMTAADLNRARRDLHVSLTLAWPGSPVREPILAQLSAIDAEIAARRIRVCTCGFATGDRAWLDGHLSDHPSHHERPQPAAPRS